MVGLDRAFASWKIEDGLYSFEVCVEAHEEDGSTGDSDEKTDLDGHDKANDEIHERSTEVHPEEVHDQEDDKRRERSCKTAVHCILNSPDIAAAPSR